MSHPIDGRITPLDGGPVKGPGLPASPTNLTEDNNDWNDQLTPGFYAPGPGSFAIENAPVTGRDYWVEVHQPGGAGGRIIQYAMTSTTTRRRVRIGGAWSGWGDYNRPVPIPSAAQTGWVLTATGDGAWSWQRLGAHDNHTPVFTEDDADPRAEQNLQSRQYAFVGKPLDITTGPVTASSPGPVRYGYSRAAGASASDGYIKGGSFVRADGGDVDDLEGGTLDGIASVNSVTTIRVPAATPKLAALVIGTTEYALTRSTDGGTTANWGGGGFDEYVVASTETERDPLGATSTAATVDDVQILYADRSPFFYIEQDSDKALDLDGLRQWTGLSGTDAEALSSRSALRLLMQAYGDDADVRLFWHHPVVSIPTGATSQDFELHPDQRDTVRLRAGDPGLYGGGDDPSEVAELDSDDLGNQLEDYYADGLGLDETRGPLALQIGRASATDIRATLLYDSKTRRLLHAPPATLDITGSPLALRAAWVKPNAVSDPIYDQNFIGPTSTIAGPRAAASYRLFGAKADLDSLREALLEMDGRDENASATLKFLSAAGNVESATIVSYSAVSEGGDSANKALAYIDLGFTSTLTSNYPTPSGGAPVAVEIPPPVQDDLFELLGTFDAGADDVDVFRDTGISRETTGMLAVQVGDGDLAVYREADLTTIGTVAADAALVTGSGTLSPSIRLGTGPSSVDADPYIGRTTGGNYAIAAASSGQRFTIYRVSPDLGFELVERVRATTDTTISAGTNVTDSGLAIPTSGEVLAIQFTNPDGGDTQDDFRVWFVKRTDITSLSASVVGSPASGNDFRQFDHDGVTVAVGRVGNNFAFHVRSIRSAVSRSFRPAVYEVDFRGGFALGTERQANITADGRSALALPPTRYFGLSLGSTQTTRSAWRDSAIRFIRRATIERFSSPVAGTASSSAAMLEAGGGTFRIGTERGRLWFDLTTAVARLRPVRAWSLNVRSDPAYLPATGSGAFVSAQASLEFTQALAGHDTVLLSEEGDTTTSIRWPDGVEHLRVTLTGANDLTDHGMWQYQVPGTTTWRSVHGPDTGAPILVAKNRRYSYRFDRDDYLSSGGELRIRLTNVPSSGILPLNQANFTGSVEVLVEYQSDEDAHAIKKTHVITTDHSVASQALTATLTGLLWGDIEFTTPVETAKILSMSIVYKPLSGSTEQIDYDFTPAVIEEMGYNPTTPSSGTTVLKAVMLAGYSNARYEPIVAPQARYPALYGPAAGPIALIGLTTDGVYATGLRCATFRYNLTITRATLIHL